MLAESVSHNVPLHPDLAGEYASYAVPDPLEVRYERAAANLTAAIDLAMERLDGRRDAP